MLICARSAKVKWCRKDKRIECLNLMWMRAIEKQSSRKSSKTQRCVHKQFVFFLFDGPSQKVFLLMFSKTTRRKHSIHIQSFSLQYDSIDVVRARAWWKLKPANRTQTQNSNSTENKKSINKLGLKLFSNYLCAPGKYLFVVSSLHSRQIFTLVCVEFTSN